MDDSATPHKATPSRRRQGRQGGKSSGQKAYASENDVPSLAVSRQSKTPRTPNKPHDTASPAPTSVPANGNSSQGSSRPRGKNPRMKPKNVPMSPENHGSPPKATASAAPSSASSTAFAGATFHASPAPSALPKPSFFSRSSDDSPLPRKDANHDLSPPVTDTEIPTPHRSAPAAAGKDYESPLDFMFRAHREEKLRQTASAKKPPVPAEMSSPPWSADARYQASSFHQGRAPATSKRANQFIDSFEWESGAREPMGPAFSTPYHDRIKAARNPRPHPDQDASRLPPEIVSEDPTEALKRYLFDKHPPSSSGPSMPTAALSQSIGGGASVPKTQVDATVYCRTNNLLVTEKDLRRILNLDLESDAPSAERRLTTR